MKETRKTKEKSLKLTTLGFTLIELLAVIVILAIIALIATPIILNIINDTKNSSNKRSIELYGKAVENAIGRYQVNNPDDKDITIEKVQEYIEYNGNKIECNIKIYKDGSVYLSKCKVSGVNVDYTYGIKQTLGKAVTKSNKTIAGKVPQGNFELGDEYIINVDGMHEYHFYILSVEENNVNLIMSNNICSDGTLATETNKCLVSWVSKNDYNDNTNYWDYGRTNKGPITAMNYLHEATKNWDNIENIQMDYTDEGSVYGTIKTSGSVTTITMKDRTTVTATYNNLKARMPKISEMQKTGCNSNEGSCPAWMVIWLKSYTDKYPEGTKENISGIYGYWSLSSYPGDSQEARRVYYKGCVSFYRPGLSSHYSGLRPVITVSKSNLS